MYRVSFYRRPASGETPRLETVTTPSIVAAGAIYRALRAAGFAARWWAPGGGLIR